MFDFKDNALNEIFGSGKVGKNNPVVYSGEFTFIDQKFYEPHKSVMNSLKLILKTQE